MSAENEWAERALRESEKTAGYSTHHHPLGHGGTNWITRTKAGNRGQLPAYVQNIAAGIARESGRDERSAIPLAIAAVKRWARGGGNVSAEVRAAAAKAVAEWEALRAKSKARTASKAIREAAHRAARETLDANTPVA